ncbi:MAG: homocysteine methyltransferase, partial [Gemmatimonas sp. SG8_17]
MIVRPSNPIQPFLDSQGFLVLDGGLATELEARGRYLDDELWSAILLIGEPDLIRQLHLDYLWAGADCIVSASYQATVAGFMRKGQSEAQATEVLRRSVRLALEARDSFWSIPLNREGRIRPIVGASVGPYGAYLADGSEYTGDYALDQERLYEFHRGRWHLLASCGADIMACETIPSRLEALVLVRLMAETPAVPAWISFSLSDATQLSDGSSLAETVKEVAAVDQVVAVGVNCIAPGIVAGAIKQVASVTKKPILAYPNSGE